MFESEMTLDISLVNEYGKDLEGTTKTRAKDSEIK